MLSGKTYSDTRLMSLFPSPVFLDTQIPDDRFGAVHYWDIIETPFGLMAAACTATGLSILEFADNDEDAYQKIWRRYSGIGKYHRQSHPLHALVSAFLSGSPMPEKLPLSPFGTDFQHRVWQALIEIPAGETMVYSGLAAKLGLPASSARAVGTAVAANPIALIIPCHRIVQKGGATGEYRWGAERKRSLLLAERKPESSGLFAGQLF
ncbi:MAG: methylated-DNA--[protein]-cysteine S-methyltransferase [Bacteroidota bacterium]